MKETKRKLMTFTFYDRTGIEKALEQEAARGWLLEKCAASGWVYRRTEPAKIHFAVTYFPAATAFDPGPSERQLRFQEFCEHTGWELIATNAQLQIYCNRAENPIPIETDPVIEVANIHASVKKTLLPTLFLNLILAVMQIMLSAQRFSFDPLAELASMGSLMMPVTWLLLLAFDVCQLWFYYRWYWKARKCAEDGQFLETKSTDRFQIVILLLTCIALTATLLSYGDPELPMVALMTVVAIIGTCAIIIPVSNWMKRKNVRAGVNQGLTYAMAGILSLLVCGAVIFLSVTRTDHREKQNVEPYEYRGMTFYAYQDELPLTIVDLMETDYAEYSCQVVTRKSSPLLSLLECRQDARMDALDQPELSYRVAEVNAAFLYERCVALMLADFAHNYARPEDDEFWKEAIPIDPTPWGAVRAYRLMLGGEAQDRYLVCYESRIMEIDLDWTPDREQMAVIGKLLNQ